MILDKIVSYKQKRIKYEKELIPLDNIISKIQSFDMVRDFKKALITNNKLSIIAEIKKASPSKGIIREDFNPLSIAEVYKNSRVEAVSILTEDKFFLGKDKYLEQINKLTSIPILRKDFIIDEYQIYQSKVLGADAVLLIVSILSLEKLIKFKKLADELGLSCLVEVHNKRELDKSLEAGVEIIGINNRDLKTFKTSLKTTEELIKYIPKNKIVISESGINSRRDMEYLQNLGVNGVLIGESLMKSKDIMKKISELRGDT